MICVVTGREVPSGGLPMDVGVLVQNVGTAAAVRDAVIDGKPLYERIVTVTGSPVAKPSNFKARIGTPASFLIEQCGGLKTAADKLIFGGPMMGFAQSSSDMPVTKTSSGIVLLSPDEMEFFTGDTCISCGRCVEVCPARLMPCFISRAVEAGDYEFAEEYSVMDCVECGSCAFVCPAHRPMVQHMRRGKAEAAARAKEEESKQK